MGSCIIKVNNDYNSPIPSEIENDFDIINGVSTTFWVKDIVTI